MKDISAVRYKMNYRLLVKYGGRKPNEQALEVNLISILSDLIWLGWVYGIPTFVGYFMPTHLCIYIYEVKIDNKVIQVEGKIY